MNEVIWGSADKLLKAIDDEYCISDINEDTYDYKKRNLSTSHVHAMLSVAMFDAIDKADVVFFINTENSVPEIENSINIGNHTLSPWIVMRKLLAKYKSEEWVSFYNSYVKEHLMKKLDIQPCIHILDCTKVLVNLDNDNYENSSVVKIDGETMRGYKLGVLRGILDDSGIAEEIVFGTLKTHDMEQCREMLKNTSCFHENDILINDRGFLSREITNYLKTERRVDTYIPARENMTVYQDAVKLATASGKWHKHPNPKRKDQEIQLVTDLGPLWESGDPEKDVPINACVVHDKKTDKYFVFMTTDTGRTARQIINTYELRPEIEEDFRQMKDFWKLEDFKNTKYNYITYHIVMTLVEYLYFQIYKNLDEGIKICTEIPACRSKELQRDKA